MDVTTGPTVAHQLRARVECTPDHDLVAAGNGWLTVQHVQERAQRLATGLHASGVRPGDRVASIMGNRPEAIDVFFACAELGAIHVPLNVYLKGEFLRYQLVDAEPAVLVVDAAGLDAAYELLSRTRMATQVVALDATDRDVRPFADLFLAPDLTWPAPTPDTIMSILYTSGTTGLPKGCVMTQGYFVHFPTAHQTFGWFTPDDTSITTLPLYHGFGLSGLMNALVSGCRIWFEESFSARALIARARDIGATQLWGVGAIGAALLATPPGPGDRDHALDRAVFIPMPPAAQQTFEERFGVKVLAEGYGQTEVLPATMAGWQPGRDKPSAGRALPWLDVRVVDVNDVVLPPGHVGEIVVRPDGPHTMFAGYWRKEAATVEAWRNLWHHTGDLGQLDDDGVLFFVDRKKDAIRRAGENVSSVELETAIVQHPAVAQVAVHATPSELMEDEIKACLVLEDGATFDAPELFEYFRENLPYYAIPRYIEVLDTLPANAMGRVLKHKLRERWDTPDTIDLSALGLRVDRAARR